MASEEERRSKILNDYCELRRTHPELPAQLRDFQVKANVVENCTFEDVFQKCGFTVGEIWFHCWREIRDGIWWQTKLEATGGSRRLLEAT